MIKRDNILKVVTVAAIGVLCIGANGQGRSGNIYEFLDMPTTSRATALGGRHAVLGADEPGFTFQNPAALRDTMSGSIGINANPLPNSIIHGSGIYAQYVEKAKGTLSCGVQYVNYGSFDRTNEYGEDLGTFSANDAAIYLTYSRQMTPTISMGATVKPIFSHMEDYNSFGLAMDLGAYYRAENGRFRAGLVVKNIGGQIKRYDADAHDDDMSQDILIGISAKPEHAPFRLTVTMKDLLHWYLAIDRKKKIAFGDNLMRHMLIGGEFIPGKAFYVAVGYNHRQRKEGRDAQTGGSAGISWGCGIRIAKIDISYGWSKYHLAGASNSITISTNINRFL